MGVVNHIIKSHCATLKKREKTLEAILERWSDEKSKDPTWALNELSSIRFAISLIEDLFDEPEELDTWGYEWVKVEKNESSVK